MQHFCWLVARTVRLKGLVVLSLVLGALLGAEYLFSPGPDAPMVMRSLVALAAPTAATAPFETLIRHDPLAAMIQARAQHLSKVRDYECRMVKQELLPSGMSEEQEIKVKYRQEPYSVYMEWLRNPGPAARVLYVKGRWTDENAEDPADRELAVVQPGIIARLFVKSVKRPIHGRAARDTSRRFVDDFGFQKTFDRLIKYCQLAHSRGELSLAFCGERRFDGRRVWVIRRHLPYTGEGGLYPDRTAEILIDQRYRVPVAVYCYSDEEQKPGYLICKYEFRGIHMGAGLTSEDFEPATYGM